MPSDDKTVSRRERFARLNHDCMAIGIWMNHEENTMKLEELKALSTKELTDLYNQYADKQVKRMESRAKLEERTIQKLREAGKLDENKTEDRTTEESATTTNNSNTEDATMAKNAATTKKSAKTAAKKAPAKKATKAPATKAPAKKASEGGKRGAPAKNPTYVAIAEGTRGYNPKKLRINPSSSRAQVLEYIAKAPTGRTKKQCEEKFADTPEVNVPSALYFLVRYGFASVKDEG